jgi:hypothetical protein
MFITPLPQTSIYMTGTKPKAMPTLRFGADEDLSQLDESAYANTGPLLWGVQVNNWLIDHGYNDGATFSYKHVAQNVGLTDVQLVSGMTTLDQLLQIEIGRTHGGIGKEYRRPA